MSYISNQRWLMDHCTTEVVELITSYAMRGLSPFSMVTVAYVVLKQVLNAVCGGIGLTHAIIGAAESGDMARDLRDLISEFNALSIADTTKRVASLCELVGVEPGSARPIHERVEGLDLLRGPVPSADELRRMHER